MIPEQFAPLFAALERVGARPPPGRTYLDVDDESFRPAIPVLVEHLQREYPDRVLVYILQHLATLPARAARPQLVRLYEESRTYSDNVRFHMAAAIARTSRPNDLQENIRLALDTTLGESRIGLLSHIGRSRKQAAVETIDRLAADPQLAREIAAIRKKRTRTKSAASSE